jgi:hypothetical protein
MIGIYCIKNKINGKVYIGKSVDIKDRFRRHRSLLNCHKHYNAHLQRSFDKHGKGNFEFCVLEECDEVDLAKKEQHWIDCNAGKVYNADLQVSDKTGVNNSFFGKKHSEETKKAMSIAKEGKYLGADNPNYGKQHSLEAKRTMSIRRATKLRPDSVVEIRSRLANGEKHADVAAMYGVSRTVITRINSGARWKLVK